MEEGELIKMEEEEKFVEQFSLDVPGFAELYDIHVENEGEPLSHVFFAIDVVKATVASYLGDPDEESDWRVTFAYLEEKFEQHIPAADRVIVTSFLEQLPYPGQPGADIVCYLGPQMKAILAKMRPSLMPECSDEEF